MWYFIITDDRKAHTVLVTYKSNLRTNDSNVQAKHIGYRTLYRVHFFSERLSITLRSSLRYSQK